MRLGFDLTIEQTQKLVMTPELIQAIQILQFNTQELDSYVQEQILANPVLEEAVDAEHDSDYGSDSERETAEEPGQYENEDNNKAFDEADLTGKSLSETAATEMKVTAAGSVKTMRARNAYERYVTNEVTLPEHLMFQFQFAAENKGCRRVGRYIIESLDENGYMTSTVEEIAEATGAPEEKVLQVLDMIHGFDPAGVG